MRRTGLTRKTPLERGTGLARTALRRRTRLKPVSAKQRREFEESRPVVAAVIERDGGCVLRGTPYLGVCFGPLSAHHLAKKSAGGKWVAPNLVCLCSAHQVAVEDHPDVAWGLGLVVRRGDTVPMAWAAMVNHRLPVGECVIECDGSLAEIPARTVVHNGLYGCPSCGHLCIAVHHPDGGPGAFVDEHTRILGVTR